MSTRWKSTVTAVFRHDRRGADVRRPHPLAFAYTPIVPEGVFTDTGHFVHIPDIWRHRAADIWQEKVFDLLLDACKIDPDVAANMRGWRHSGFNVDNSVRIEAGDNAGMQRLVEYISRCPLSLARMVTLNADGRIVYRASKGKCFPFPQTGEPVAPERCAAPIQTLMEGIPRNFESLSHLTFWLK